jgi:NADPH:quinone reductase-like Zn-dependent oxidoreductase
LIKGENNGNVGTWAYAAIAGLGFMKLRYKIGIVILALVGIGVLWLGYSLSHDAACGPAPALPSNTTAMKAIVYRCYGSPDVLKVENVEKPTAADNEVLIKVHAASVNPLDWHFMRGMPYFMRLQAGMGAPKDTRLGVDFAGTIEAAGKNVKRFKPGDEVFGGADGAFAEYVAVPEDDALALKPSNISFEQAASVPIAALTALQALRDKGRLQPGQKVLINGASGGVGTFAVQIAKSFGADVTGVCSTRNVDMVRSIGADHVIDYTQEDFTASGIHYDLIIDTVGNHSLPQYRRALTPTGIFVVVGGPNDGHWIGPMTGFINAKLLSPFVSQTFVPFLARLTQKDLSNVADLMQAGKVTPVIDRSYKLSEVPAAMRYLEQGHARGKVVIALD